MKNEVGNLIALLDVSLEVMRSLEEPGGVQIDSERCFVGQVVVFKVGNHPLD